MSDMTNRAIAQAIAARLATVLERYDLECAEMVRTWLDMELYAEVSALVDEMRACCLSLPRLSVPWVALLISHSELVFCLWREGSGSSCSPAVQACVGQHSVAVRDLQQSCGRLCEEGQAGPAPPPLPIRHPAPRSRP